MVFVLCRISFKNFKLIFRVIRGIGELDAYEREKRARKLAHMERYLHKLQQDLDLPYLLLDMRTRDDYDQSHIITALNYPVAMLARTMNNETPELLAYKNQPGKIIVVYDDDERVAPRAAQTLVERGYENMFMLSGGMKLAWKKFPQGLVTGLVPSFYSLPTARADGKQQPPLPLPSSTAASGSMHQREAISSMSNASLASHASSLNKKRFERDDIEKLNQYLEGTLMPHEQRYSSRMSTAGKSSRHAHSCVDRSEHGGSVASTAKTVATSIHEKAWR